jgi:hypothetical protein
LFFILFFIIDRGEREREREKERDESGEKKNKKCLECVTIANFREIAILKGLLEHQNC